MFKVTFNSQEKCGEISRNYRSPVDISVDPSTLLIEIWQKKQKSFYSGLCYWLCILCQNFSKAYFISWMQHDTDNIDIGDIS